MADRDPDRNRTSLVPKDMVAEVTGGLIVLDLADGSQATITIPKARWYLFAETRDTDQSRWWEPAEPEWAMYAENWYGAMFHPLEMLPGPNRAAFRLTHYHAPGGPRVRVEIPETAEDAAMAEDAAYQAAEAMAEEPDA